MNSHIAWQESKNEKAIEVNPEIRDIQKGTILFVEDEDIVREAVSEFLQASGYQVLKARTPNEAVTLFCQHRHEVQVLIADLALPGQNGRRLASYLRELQPNFKTVFISGYPEHIIAMSLKTSPPNFYLAKPFSLESLLEKIEQACAVKMEQAEAAMHASCTE